MLGGLGQHCFGQALHVSADAGILDSAQVECDSHEVNYFGNRPAAAVKARGRPECSLSRTMVKMEWRMAWCMSSIICTWSQGTTAHRSQSCFIFPPWYPATPTAMAPWSRAVLRARSTLGELPLALIAKATSPLRTKFFSCSEKT